MSLSSQQRVLVEERKSVSAQVYHLSDVLRRADVVIDNGRNVGCACAEYLDAVTFPGMGEQNCCTISDSHFTGIFRRRFAISD